MLDSLTLLNIIYMFFSKLFYNSQRQYSLFSLHVGGGSPIIWNVWHLTGSYQYQGLGLLEEALYIVH